MQVDLVWLEATGEGSAARTHLDGTLLRLQMENVGVRSVITSSVEMDGGLCGKFVRLSRLVRSARALPPGVLIARWHPLLALVSPGYRRRGGRVLLLIQGNDSTMYESNPWMAKLPFSRWLVRRSLESTDDVLVLNEGLADWLMQENALPDGVTPELLETGVADAFFDADGSESGHGRYVLFVGTLAIWQGIDTLIAARESASWPAGVDLIVVGDGAERQSVEAAAKRARLLYLGRLPMHEVAPLVGGAICTICPKIDSPSMAETTTPFKVLESVAAGVPVVMSDIPAQRRMARANDYAELFPAGDADALARSVARVATDTRRRTEMSRNARSAAPGYRWGAKASLLSTTVRGLNSGVG